MTKRLSVARTIHGDTEVCGGFPGQSAESVADSFVHAYGAVFIDRLYSVVVITFSASHHRGIQSITRNLVR